MTNYNSILTAVEIKPLNFPDKFDFKQNYSNPFNPGSIIVYSIPEAANVQLIVYDILGKEITRLVNEEKQPGNYEVLLMDLL